MVVRNARLRINGLSVGGWDDKLKLDANGLRVDIVEAFKAFISDNAMRKRKFDEGPSGDRKRQCR